MDSNERPHFGQNLLIKQTIICILDQLFQLFNKQNENYDPFGNIKEFKTALNKHLKKHEQNETFVKFIKQFQEKVNLNVFY